MLVRLLTDVGRQCQSDDAGQTVHRVLCIDPSHDAPFLVGELRRFGISVTQLECKAEDVVDAVRRHSLADETRPTAEMRQITPPFGRLMKINWVESLYGKNEFPLPEPIANINISSDISPAFRLFRHIRQLGIKTGLVEGVGIGDESDERKNHNRLVHSAGVAFIATKWLTELIERTKNFDNVACKSLHS